MLNRLEDILTEYPLAGSGRRVLPKREAHDLVRKGHFLQKMRDGTLYTDWKEFESKIAIIMGPVETFSEQIYFCEFCHGPGTTKHHLHPKEIVGRTHEQKIATIRLCRPCHGQVHSYFTNLELHQRFNTAETLRAELFARRQSAPNKLVVAVQKPRSQSQVVRDALQQLDLIGKAVEKLKQDLQQFGH